MKYVKTLSEIDWSKTDAEVACVHTEAVHTGLPTSARVKGELIVVQIVKAAAAGKQRSGAS